jgi:hypothetical protein
MTLWNGWHIMRGWRSATLLEARQWLSEHVDEGAICPCCDQPAKVYPRNLSSGMAVALIKIYHSGGALDYIKTRYIDNSGTLSKLRHWGLIEMADQRGYWKMTEIGVRFVEDRIKIPKFIILYNKSFLGYDDSEETTIREALKAPFDYDEMMTRGV